MSSTRGPKLGQSNRLDKYAFSKPPPAEHSSPKATPKSDAAETTPELTLKDVMEAMSGVRTSLEQRMDTISTDIMLIKADMGKNREKVQQLEVTTSSLVADTTELQRSVRVLEDFRTFAEAKLDDYEGRNRRNNVRILGVPEKFEGQSTDLFVEELITKHLQPKGLSKFFVVERAHRVPGGRPRTGTAPRPIVARLLNYRDRDVILQHARVAPPLKLDNSTVTFFPDFTQMVQRQRRSFQGLKQRLCDQGLKYAMLFPARLRVEANGKAWFFDNPESASEWLDGWRPAAEHNPG